MDHDHDCDSRKYSCKICKEEFQHSSALKMHLNKQHTKSDQLNDQNKAGPNSYNNIDYIPRRIIKNDSDQSYFSDTDSDKENDRNYQKRSETSRKDPVVIIVEPEISEKSKDIFEFYGNDHQHHRHLTFDFNIDYYTTVPSLVKGESIVIETEDISLQ
ncbi:hypothetical protein TKK_0003588 [Trichogramma kaykai]